MERLTSGPLSGGVSRYGSHIATKGSKLLFRFTSEAVMRRFSERFRYQSIRTVVQIDEMDDELRNSLWNLLVEYYFTRFAPTDTMTGYPHATKELQQLVHLIWRDLFKQPTDTVGATWSAVYVQLREHFLTTTWNGVYDFVEFVPNNFPDDYYHSNAGFVAACNQVLLRELSGWRFSGTTLVKITSEEELSAIDEARELPRSMKVVGEHLNRALQLISDRKKPDYRNSIKEAISAVEGFCSLLAGQDKADLDAALDVLEKRIKLHKALKKAFNSLYGYTSDANGIRHALLDEANLTFDEAKFMLVSCSAFINYLKGAASGAGIKL